MTSGQKTAFSLLATMIIYTAFVLVANTKLNLFDNLEKQYYSQAKVKEKVEQLDKITESYDSYITNVLNKIQDTEDSYLKSDAVLSYFDYNPSEKLIEQRRIKTAQLFYDVPGLDGLRIVDSEGRFVHYSSYDSTDLTNKDSNKKIYDTYKSIEEKQSELPFDLITSGDSSTDSVARKLSIDSERQRIIISFPIYRLDSYAGVLLAYFNFNEVQKELENSYLSKNSLEIIGDKNLFGGFVTGIPPKDIKTFIEPVENYWKARSLEKEIKSSLPEKILQIDDGRYYEILSSTKSQYFNISGVYTNDIFELSKEIKLLIYIGVGITLFLLIFLIFSFKGDSVVTLKKRIRRIQYGVINEYLTNKEEIEWDKVVGQIKLRQNELSKEILKAARVSKRKEKELDEVLSKSWEEIFAVIEPKVEAKQVEIQQSSGVSKEELRQMLEEVLKETKLNVNVATVAAPAPVKAKKTVPVPVEELAEDVEEIEEIEELADDVEEIEEVEELADDVEEIEEIEELADDVEELEEIEEVEELSDDVEEIEEVEELTDDVEEIEEVEELADDVEELDEIEEVEELVDDVEELEEIEEIEDLADDVEDLEEIEELADDVEELEEVAPDPYVDESLKLVKALSGTAQYEYCDSNDTFIDLQSLDDFANVENLFAEEICLGEHYHLSRPESNVKMNFTVYQFIEEIKEVEEIEEIEDVELEPVDSADEESVEELEDLTDEDMFISDDYFAMTQFGANNNGITELEGINAGSIVENEGVYQISDNIQYTDVIQDPEFKNLVDSVLK